MQAARRGGRPAASRGVVLVALDETGGGSARRAPCRQCAGAAGAPTPRAPSTPRVKQLEAENRRLQRKLQRAETIITLQKKVAEILRIPLKPLDIDETD